MHTCADIEISVYKRFEKNCNYFTRFVEQHNISTNNSVEFLIGSEITFIIS